MSEKEEMDQDALDNRSDQLNPNHDEYQGEEDDVMEQHDLDNRADQLNPSNPAYHSSRK